MVSILQQANLINFLRERQSFSLLYRVISGRGFPNERMTISIVLLAMRSGKWPTSFAALLELQTSVRNARTKYESELVEYRMMQQFNLWSFWKNESSREVPCEPFILILGSQTDSEILDGLGILLRDGLVEMCDNSIVTPTDKFFNLILVGCQDQGYVEIEER